MKHIDDSTDWLAPNNVGIAIGAFFIILRIRKPRTLNALRHVVVDAIWH